MSASILRSGSKRSPDGSCASKRGTPLVSFQDVQSDFAPSVEAEGLNLSPEPLQRRGEPKDLKEASSHGDFERDEDDGAEQVCFSSALCWLLDKFCSLLIYCKVILVVNVHGGIMAAAYYSVSNGQIYCIPDRAESADLSFTTLLKQQISPSVIVASAKLEANMLKELEMKDGGMFSPA